jgi:hypothetical protein
MYMIFQQYTTAIKTAYSGREEVAENLQKARMCREWLESLTINIKLRNELIEPIKVLEEAFQDLANHS